MTKLSELKSTSGSTVRDDDIFVTVISAFGEDGTRTLTRSELFRALEEETFTRLKSQGGEASTIRLEDPNIVTEAITSVDDTDRFIVQRGSRARSITYDALEEFLAETFARTAQFTSGLYVNYLTEGVLTASSGNVEDLHHQDGELWEPTSIPASVELQLQDETELDCLVIINHTLGSTGTTFDFQHWTGSAWVSVFDTPQAPATDENLYILFPAQESTGWRLQLTASTSGDPTIDLVMLGQKRFMLPGFLAEELATGLTSTIESLDDENVKLETEQTIAGLKTFTNQIRAQSNATIGLQFRDGSNDHRGQIVKETSTNDILIERGPTDAVTTRLSLKGNGDIEATVGRFVGDGSGLTNVTGNQGPIGYTGSVGEQGIQGPRGYTGSQGIQGEQGVVGAQGFTGSRGSLGYTGSQGAGFTGSRGDQGLTGFIGSRGFTGSVGNQGIRGFTGSRGVQGATGFTGSVGPQGTSITILGTLPDVESLPGTGDNSGDSYSIGGDLYVWSGSSWVNVGPLQGPTGPVGYVGSQGGIGYSGSRGYTGSRGIQGEQGVVGFAGSVGSQGPIGYSGSRGPQGDQGIQGIQGFTGSRGFTGSVGGTGFVGSRGAPGDRGLLGNTGPRGYTGSRGTQGTQGVAGFTGSIGYTGSQGPIGIGYTGSRGLTGSVGLTGNQGIQGFTGSRGAGFTGSQGVQGVQGFQGNIGFTGSRGFTGSTGFVGSRGSGFTGSRGNIGYTGSRGNVGFTGSAGPKGDMGPAGNIYASAIPPASPSTGDIWVDIN